MKKITYTALFLLVAIASNAQTATVTPGLMFTPSFGYTLVSNTPCGLVYDSAEGFKQMSDTVYVDTVNAKALMLNWKDTTLKVIYAVAVRRTNFCDDTYEEHLFYKDVFTSDMKSFYPLDGEEFIKVIWKASYPDHPHSIVIRGL